MRIRTSLLLALGVGVLGVGLRAAIPVAPVDDAFRDVIRFYRALEPAAR
ncbi:hypothetical protein [Methylobacterium haplocladii]|nr:hypothetical protein [Methylobacterium haplocladii]